MHALSMLMHARALNQKLKNLQYQKCHLNGKEEE